MSLTKEDREIIFNCMDMKTRRSYLESEDQEWEYLMSDNESMQYDDERHNKRDIIAMHIHQVHKWGTESDIVDPEVY